MAIGTLLAGGMMGLGQAAPQIGEDVRTGIMNAMYADTRREAAVLSARLFGMQPDTSVPSSGGAKQASDPSGLVAQPIDTAGSRDAIAAQLRDALGKLAASQRPEDRQVAQHLGNQLDQWQTKMTDFSRQRNQFAAEFSLRQEQAKAAAAAQASEEADRAARLDMLRAQGMRDNLIRPVERTVTDKRGTRTETAYAPVGAQSYTVDEASGQLRRVAPGTAGALTEPEALNRQKTIQWNREYRIQQRELDARFQQIAASVRGENGQWTAVERDAIRTYFDMVRDLRGSMNEVASKYSGMEGASDVIQEYIQYGTRELENYATELERRLNFVRGKGSLIPPPERPSTNAQGGWVVPGNTRQGWGPAR